MVTLWRPEMGSMTGLKERQAALGSDSDIDESWQHDVAADTAPTQIHCVLLSGYEQDRIRHA